MLGVLGDSLLRGVPWGLGAFAWTTLMITITVFVARWYGKSMSAMRWMWLPLVFASFFTWRDSPSLRGWNALGLVAALTFSTLPAVGMCLRSSGVWAYCRNTMSIWINTAVGAAKLKLDDDAVGDPTTEGAASSLLTVSRGVLFATPLTLIFCSLLMSADPVFDRVVRSAFAWDYSEAGSHLLLSGALAWLVAGYMWGIASMSQPLGDRSVGGSLPSLGITEVGIALGSLVLVFLLFVVIQIEYLFGGESLILATEGLSYAEYARSGFFELVAVAALVVPVLLAANGILVQKSERDRQSFEALATVTLILVAMIMASALQRMQLYADMYGLTHDRLYASVFMGWIGTVLGLFAGTVLFGSGRHFVLATSLSAFAFLGLLNAANPDALIARTHIARAEAGKPVDVSYIGSLSDDAVPLVLDRLSAVDFQGRCELLGIFYERRVDRRTGWRNWNVGRHRATVALGEPRLAADMSICSSP
jgi:hypothetical protein